MPHDAILLVRHSTYLWSRTSRLLPVRLPTSARQLLLLPMENSSKSYHRYECRGKVIDRKCNCLFLDKRSNLPCVELNLAFPVVVAPVTYRTTTLPTETISKIVVLTVFQCVMGECLCCLLVKIAMLLQTVLVMCECFT